jgi:hypothetical protein
MAATWRPPEGLVLESRERGGRLARGGEEGDRFPHTSAKNYGFTLAPTVAIDQTK